MTSSKKNKQLQTYDPAFAGKQVAGGAGPNPGQGSRSGARGPNLSLGREARSTGAPQPRPQQQNTQPRNRRAAEPDVQYQARGSRNERYDDGDSALLRGGFDANEAL